MGDAALSLLSLGLDIATFGKKKTDAERIEEQEREQTELERKEDSERRHIRKINQLNRQKKMWQNGPLHKTTLHPGALISGKLYTGDFKFHNEDDTINIQNALTIHCPINNINFTFPFSPIDETTNTYPSKKDG